MNKASKEERKEKIKEQLHPYYARRTFGQKSADNITKWAGSWTFIIIFLILVSSWIVLNGYYLIEIYNKKPFDPFPYILLNLALSLIAALQAPVILMSQNRQSEIDRVRAEYDYRVNRKAERGITEIKELILKLYKKKK